VRGLADGSLEIPHWIAEDVEIVNFDEAPVPGRFVGHEGLREWARESFGPAVEDGGFRFEGPPEPVAPNVIVRRQTAMGRGKETEIGIEWPMVGLACFRDGKIVYMKGFLRYEDAVEAGRRWAAEHG
jgi:hypothetical protein